jgi:hypothetical protein
MRGSIQRLRGWLLFCVLVGNGLLRAGTGKAAGWRISSLPASLRFEGEKELVVRDLDGEADDFTCAWSWEGAEA